MASISQWLEPLLEQLALATDHRTLVMPTLDIIPEVRAAPRAIRWELRMFRGPVDMRIVTYSGPVEDCYSGPVSI